MNKTLKLLVGLIVCPAFMQAQTHLYEESHKEIEYNYGVIENNWIDSISEIEKIKYNFRFTEKSVSKSIDNNYHSYEEVILDTISNEQAWMNLSHKFTYSNNEMRIWGRDGVLLKTVPFTEEQIKQEEQMRFDIIDNGFHPGILMFPQLSDSFPDNFSESGITIQKLEPGVFKLQTNELTTTYNRNNLTIIKEWIDEDGIRNIETLGYAPFGENKGFLLTIEKQEKFKHSEKGICITEVTLRHFHHYQVNDIGNLMLKALQQEESISLSPNPNDGNFNLEIQLAEGNQLLGIEIVRLLNGQTIPVPMYPSQKSFQINKTELLPGQYVVRVKTANSVLTKHFIKY